MSPGLMAHVFGEEKVANLAINEHGRPRITFLQPGDSESAAAFTTLKGATRKVLSLAGDGLILRFTDAQVFDSVVHDAPELIQRAKLIWLHVGNEPRRLDCIETLARFGFDHQQTFQDQPGILLARKPISVDPAPDYTARAGFIMRRLVLIDNNLTGERGHFLALASLIARGAEEAGVRMIWAGNERLDIDSVPAGVAFEPAFRHSSFDAASAQDDSVAFQQDLTQVIERHSAPGTHFLIPTMDGNHVRAIFRLLQRKIEITDALHLCTPYEPRHMPHRFGVREIDWYLARIREDPAFGASIFLWAETQVLADLLADRLSCRVERLSLPAPRWRAEKAAVAETGPVTLAFFGYARIDKGILELPEIVSSIFTAVEPERDARVVLRIVPPYGGYTDPIIDAIDRLGAMPGVEIAEGTLTPTDYRATMLACDGLLLPYRADIYAARGSGILVEGIASGRVIFAAAGTLAEELVEEGLIFLCGPPADWASAVAALVARRRGLLLEAKRRGLTFQRRHAPRSYIDRIACRAEFDRRAAPEPTP